MRPKTSKAARVRRFWRFLAAVTFASLQAIGLVGTPVEAQVTNLTVNKCLAGKIKAVGKTVSGRAACISKETGSGNDNPDCPLKPSDKFTGGSNPSKGSFNKLDEKYPLDSATPCVTFEDQDSLESTIADYVDDLAPTTGGAPGKCDAAKIKCVGKYAASYMKCAAKAASKPGTIERKCTDKAASNLTGESACLVKAVEKEDCTFPGNAQAEILLSTADTFLQSALCLLDPVNAGCLTFEPPSIIRNSQVLAVTVGDPPGVSSVTYKYCPGVACSPSIVIDSSTDAPSYSITWSSQPADGVYQVSATALDSFGNPSTVRRSITIDNTAPSALVTSPSAGDISLSNGSSNPAGTNYPAESAWSNSISGTASDDLAGVSRVDVSIRQVSSGNYWNGAAFASSTEQFFTATGTTSWTFPFDGSNFTAGGAYSVRARALDTVGNEASSSAISFSIDYDPSRTVFVATTGNDGNSGLTASSPKLTIAGAVAVASNARPLVAIAAGPYPGTVNLPGATANPIILRGGYGSSFKLGTIGSNVVTITGSGGAQTTGAVVSGSEASLHQLTIDSGTSSGSAGSAYGLRALNGAVVTVTGSVISAGAGRDGDGGTTPSGALTAGSAGGNGTNGGQGIYPAGSTTGGIGINVGGDGGAGTGASGTGGASGGSGGSGGCSNCTSNSNHSSGGGSGGRAGANGTTGTNGSAGAAAYAAAYAPAAGGNGGTGGNGGGGGGGGGAGRACDNSFCAGNPTGGGSGAKGGGGGQGGGGGTSGATGGGSFAVYSYNSTVTIDADTVMTAASGGDGGSGAAGQAGAAGGSGGTGGSGHIADCCTGTPGNGGTAGPAATNGGTGGSGAAGTCCNAASGGGGGGGGGGNGGSGGIGGGGAGGPSVGMLSTGSGGISFTGSLASNVAIGAGGIGGAAPGGGNSGAAGTAAKVFVIP